MEQAPPKYPILFQYAYHKLDNNKWRAGRLKAINDSKIIPDQDKQNLINLFKKAYATYDNTNDIENISDKELNIMLNTMHTLDKENELNCTP